MLGDGKCIPCATWQRVLEDNHAFKVDTTPGITPERWAAYKRAQQFGKYSPFVKSRAVHNSHLLVIQRKE